MKKQLKINSFITPFKFSREKEARESVCKSFWEEQAKIAKRYLYLIKRFIKN